LAILSINSRYWIDDCYFARDRYSSNLKDGAKREGKEGVWGKRKRGVKCGSYSVMGP
jgi:hypothetical protein